MRLAQGWTQRFCAQLLIFDRWRWESSLSRDEDKDGLSSYETHRCQVQHQAPIQVEPEGDGFRIAREDGRKRPYELNPSYAPSH
jgi:hypothetical protein